MARYKQDSKERVRDAVDFVDLVSARTELRRAGANRYEGLCPFHDERTPSFGIDPTNKLYHCFGCQTGGDLFDFVAETEGLDFVGALELLADRYGVELEREAEDPRELERRRREQGLLELLARTTIFYERFLWDSAEAAGARAYLGGRGLEREHPARVPRRLRPERVGPRAARLPPQRLLRGASSTPPGWPSARSRTGAPTTASVSASSFRWLTYAGGSSATAPARCATTSGPST